MGYDEFKCKFINDMSRFENIKPKTLLLKSALDRTVKEILPSRDNYGSFQIRDFTNTEALKIRYNSPHLMCKYSIEKKRIFVGTLAPAWSFGWRTISKDAFVSDQIGGFFYLANQYISRAYQINLIGAIALTYGRPCDFRGDELQKYQLPNCNSEYTAFRSDIPKIQSKRNRKLARYLDLINSLDPYVNKLLYYYVRSLSLFAEGYDEEAIMAADNAIDVTLQAVKQRKQFPTMSRREMYCELENEINLPNGTVEQLGGLYQLRCSFSAHPAHSKWWDFYEIYETDIEPIKDAVKATIIKFLMYETENRRIDKTPSCWSEWFMNNCSMVYDAVWFHKLPDMGSAP